MCTFEPLFTVSKVLPLWKTKKKMDIFLLFHSLNRTFVPSFGSFLHLLIGCRRALRAFHAFIDGDEQGQTPTRLLYQKNNHWGDEKQKNNKVQMKMDYRKPTAKVVEVASNEMLCVSGEIDPWQTKEEVEFPDALKEGDLDIF